MKFNSLLASVFSLVCLSGATAFGHSIDTSQCKFALLSESKTLLGCEICKETDSGACSYYEGQCFIKSVGEAIETLEEVDCESYSCGLPEVGCQRLYSGSEAIQSLQGDLVTCRENKKMICKNTVWQKL